MVVPRALRIRRCNGRYRLGYEANDGQRLWWEALFKQAREKLILDIRLRGVVALVAGLAFLASACGGSGVEELGADLDLDAATPLEVMFVEAGGQDAALRSWQVAVQEDTATCMIEQGFQFTVSVAPIPVMFAEKDSMPLGQWTEMYGYGVSTSADAMLSIQAADPNTQYLLGLPPSEREAYLVALVGEILGGSQSPLVEQPPLAEQGCTGAAVLAHGGSAITEDLEVVNQEFQERTQAMQASSEMQAPLASWQECMATEGFSFRTHEAIVDNIAGQLNSLLFPVQDQSRSLDAEERDRLFANPDSATELLPGLDIDALKKLQEWERRVALVDLACYDDHVKATLVPLRVHLEREIISEYNDELNAAKDILSS